jgi:DMSO/TMAO reductase YedYZ molybdopterin-dependent catalytic subunit
LDVDSFTLTVDGEVDHPIVLRYDELLAMPATERSVRLVCVSGPRERTLMKGVALSHLFELARVRDSASLAVFHCPDGYRERVPLVEVLRCESFLVYSVDGESADKLGWLLRLAIPGKSGYKWAKTVQRVELVAHER